MEPLTDTTAPLRLGVIGCGSIARAHAAAIRLNADDGLVRCVAAADPDQAGIDQFEAIAGSIDRRSANGHDVVDAPDVDAVVLITPTRFHREYVLAVCDAGKPLFTEKPLAPTFAVVRELCDAVEAARITAQVGFQSRFHPIVRRLREIVVSGELGAPMAYTLRDDQYWPTGEVVPGHSSWRSDVAEAGGGALLEHSIHSCDVLAWLFGPAARVYAAKRHVFGYSVEDVAALTIEHAGGVVGNLVTVFNGVRGREERRLEVFFERGSLELTTDFVVGAPEDSLLIQRPDAPAERVDVDRLRRDTFAADGCDPDRQVFVYQYFSHRAFARAVREGTTPSPGFADAYNAHAIVEAGYRSAASGVPVDLASL
jgi:predicted dehydrogenase